MFWNKFVMLCNQKGKSPNGVCSELGFSANTATKWKQGAVPRDTTLKKIAEYFEVTVDFLLGNEAKEKGTTQMVAPITELSPREVQVALAYRAQDDAVKAAIDKMLDIPPLAEEGLA